MFHHPVWECGFKVEVNLLQFCLTLCNPMNYIIHGILQARILEWVAFSFSTGSSQLRDWTQISCIADRFFNTWAAREAQEYWSGFSSVQFSSVAQSCLTLCNSMNHSIPGLPVYHQLPKFTQTHVHRVSDAIQPSHTPAPNPSQHQGLFQWVSSSHEVVKVLEFQLQHPSFQWTPRTDLL